MAQYIDKSALVAEIERIKKSISPDRFLSEFEKGCNHGKEDVCDDLLSFLDTLEVKEVDLKKEYDNEFFKDPVFVKLVNRNAGISIAKHFFELGLKAKGE